MLSGTGRDFFGHLSDRLDRIRVLTFTILMFSVFTVLCAVAQGYWDLPVYHAQAEDQAANSALAPITKPGFPRALHTR